MATIAQKVKHVLAAKAHDGKHHCHWPGCGEPVPPARWGCRKHWYLLPEHLRKRIWDTYRPGQEITKTPSPEYVAAAMEVRRWIEAYLAKQNPLFPK